MYRKFCKMTCVCTLLTCWTNILSIEVLQRNTVAKNVKFCPEIMTRFCLLQKLQKWKSNSTIIARIPEFFQEFFTVLVSFLNFHTRKKNKHWKCNKIQRAISKISHRKSLKSRPDKAEKVNFWHGFPLNLFDEKW